MSEEVRCGEVVICGVFVIASMCWFSWWNLVMQLSGQQCTPRWSFPVRTVSCYRRRPVCKGLIFKRRVCLISYLRAISLKCSIETEGLTSWDHSKSMLSLTLLRISVVRACDSNINSSFSCLETGCCLYFIILLWIINRKHRHGTLWMIFCGRCDGVGISCISVFWVCFLALTLRVI